MCNSQHIHSYNYLEGGKNDLFGLNMSMDRSLRGPDKGEKEMRSRKKC